MLLTPRDDGQEAEKDEVPRGRPARAARSSPQQYRMLGGRAGDTDLEGNCATAVCE